MDVTLLLSIILSVIGNSINGLGYVIQKKAHMRILASAEKKNFVCDKQWFGGLVIYALGSALQGAALSIGPQALLTLFESFTLVSNAALAPCFLGEKITWRELVSTAFIIAGASVAVIFGPSSTKTYTVDELTALYGRTPFIIFCCVVGGAGLCAWLGLLLVFRWQQSQGIVLNGRLDVRGAYYIVFAICGIAAMWSAFTLILTKSAFGVLLLSFDGNNQFKEWITYVMLIAFIVFTITTEYWKQRGLKLFQALYVVPLLKTSLLIVSVLAGGVYFEELNGLSATNGALFGVGILVICVGIFLLSTAETNEQWRPPEAAAQAGEAPATVEAGNTTSVGPDGLPIATAVPAGGEGVELALKSRAGPESATAASVSAGLLANGNGHSSSSNSNSLHPDGVSSASASTTPAPPATPPHPTGNGGAVGARVGSSLLLPAGALSPNGSPRVGSLGFALVPPVQYTPEKAPAASPVLVLTSDAPIGAGVPVSAANLSPRANRTGADAAARPDEPSCTLPIGADAGAGAGGAQPHTPGLIVPSPRQVVTAPLPPPEMPAALLMQSELNAAANAPPSGGCGAAAAAAAPASPVPGLQPISGLLVPDTAAAVPSSPTARTGATAAAAPVTPAPAAAAVPGAAVTPGAVVIPIAPAPVTPHLALKTSSADVPIATHPPGTPNLGGMAGPGAGGAAQTPRSTTGVSIGMPPVTPRTALSLAEKRAQVQAQDEAEGAPPDAYLTQVTSPQAYGSLFGALSLIGDSLRLRSGSGSQRSRGNSGAHAGSVPNSTRSRDNSTSRGGAAPGGGGSAGNSGPSTPSHLRGQQPQPVAGAPAGQGTGVYLRPRSHSMGRDADAAASLHGAGGAANPAGVTVDAVHHRLLLRAQSTRDTAGAAGAGAPIAKPQSPALARMQSTPTSGRPPLHAATWTVSAAAAAAAAGHSPAHGAASPLAHPAAVPGAGAAGAPPSPSVSQLGGSVSGLSMPTLSELGGEAALPASGASAGSATTPRVVPTLNFSSSLAIAAAPGAGASQSARPASKSLSPAQRTRPLDAAPAASDAPAAQAPAPPLVLGWTATAAPGSDASAPATAAAAPSVAPASGLASPRADTESAVVSPGIGPGAGAAAAASPAGSVLSPFQSQSPPAADSVLAQAVAAPAGAAPTILVNPLIQSA